MFMSPMAALAIAVSTNTVPAPAPEALVEVEFLQPLTRSQTFSGPGNLRMLSGLPPNMGLEQVFEQDFATQDYFAAFAVSKDGGYGFSTGTNTLEAARYVAMANCLNFNAECRIMAEITPQGYTGPQQGVMTLTPEVAQYYLTAQNYGTFRAMATTASGAYALSFNHPSQAAADAQALADCEGFRLESALGASDFMCVLVPDLP